MSDVGLQADLLLDVRQALQAVERVNEALNRATTSVQITADTRALTASIDAAVQNANAALTLVADAGDVTASIDSAVDNADTQLTLFADAGDITGSIDAAVQNADTNIEITADTRQAVAAVDQVDASAKRAGASAGGLKQILAAISVGAIVGGLVSIATAASDMAESTSKATVVFGDSFAEVEQFTRDAATAIGLSRAEALEAAGTFGNLFNALGLTKDAAADLAPEVLTLGADLASFNNLGVDDTLEKIRSGLIGEIEPLRSLGISFGAAQVEAKAFELGLVAANGELSEGAKVQARWALIAEQSTNAAGDFARTSDGLANQQRILKAELQNTAIAAGENLLPIFLDLVATAREDFVPQLAVIADRLLPAVASAMASLAEGGGASLLSVLAALTPILQAVAFVLEAIPTPVLGAATTTLTLVKVLTLVSPAFAAARTAGLGFAASIAAINPVLLAATAAFVVFSTVMGQNAEAEAKRKSAVDAVRSSLAAAVPTQDAYTDSITKAAEESEAMRDALTEAGTTATGFAKALAAGSVASERFANLSVLSQVALHEQTVALQDAAKAELDLAVATGDVSKVQRDAALFQTKLTDGTYNYAGALVIVRDAELEHEERLNAIRTRYEEQATAVANAALGYDALAQSSEGVANTVDRLLVGTTDVGRNLFNLAVGVDAAVLSEEDLATVAGQLGVELEDLAGFIDTVTAAIDEFVDSVESKLPDTASIIADLGSAGEISAEKLIASLEEQAEAIATFEENVRTLVAQGFGDLAQIALQQGPIIGGQLAKDLADGTEKQRLELRAQQTDFTESRDSLVAFTRDEFGPDMLLATGEVGRAATDAFGEDFDLTGPAASELAAVMATLDANQQLVAAVAAKVGAASAREFGEALGLDEEAIAEAVKAGIALTNNSPTGRAYNAGRDVGVSFGDGMAAGIEYTESQVEAQVQKMIRLAEEAARIYGEMGSPSRLFARVGEDLGAGLVQGLASTAKAIADEASNAVVVAAGAVTSSRLPLASIDPNITAASTGATSGLSFNAVPGMVVVNVTGVDDPQVARQVGAAAASGFLDELARDVEIERRLR